MATTKITSPDLFNLESLNTALKLPSGTTAQRPTSPSTGEWRYNTTTNYVEFWDGGEWRDLQSENIPPINSENFNTVLYTGTGSAQSITGVGFKPDWVWIKDRDTNFSHAVTDSTRGVGNIIKPNSSDAQSTDAQSITSFDADGFSLGTAGGSFNNNGDNYVAWCWKANGGTTSSNTDGDITSTVQANTKAGFSIITYTGNGSSAQTVGHGLGVAPKLMIIKEIAGSNSWDDWIVGGDIIDNWTKYLRLNQTAASTAGYQTAPFSDTAPTSSVFTVTYQGGAGINGSGDTFVAYAFADVAGYSKFSTYTGNGSAAGPIVNTGFEPAFVMVKTASGNNGWAILDNKRNTTNIRNLVLFANSDEVEYTASGGGGIDFLSNGFQVNSTENYLNANGETFIYIAFGSDASAAPVLADSFANKLYTGNGGTQAITGLGFSPSLVWQKERGQAVNHRWIDTVRGATNAISSSLTVAEFAESTGLTSFDTDGFTVGSNVDYNNNGGTFVAWNWKAASVPAINTDGTDTSIVSANVAAGFSIAVLPNKAGSQNLGHGLDGVPDLIIMKQYEGGTGNWTTYNSPIGVRNFMNLNTSASNTVASPGYEYDAVTATTITNLISGSTYSYIYYCFKSVAGFSKIGSYTGTGATHAITGVGFQPSWIMGKEVDGTDSWEIVDSARGINKMVYANGANAEVTNTNFTSFDSDGFTLSSATSINESGKTYIYMAFKENPVQYAIPSGKMGYLVAAGGGGGGFNIGAGGGAGGLRTSYGLTSGGGASAESNITLTSGTYTITIGAGGIAGTYTPSFTKGGDGTNSSIAGSGLTTITSIAGGGAGTGISGQTPKVEPGRDGGSGGGGSRGPNEPGGAGTANQGFAGGASNVSNGDSSGGGGGATQAGQTPSGGGGGDGGNGLTSAITGSNSGYTGGGGGGSFTGGGPVGLGKHGGGAGIFTGTPNAGAVNTGGGAGGGGGSGADSARIGGVGGSGVVILRLNTSDYSGTTTGSPTVTTNGSETILTYTGSGTYVHS